MQKFILWGIVVLFTGVLAYAVYRLIKLRRTKDNKYLRERWFLLLTYVMIFQASCMFISTDIEDLMRNDIDILYYIISIGHTILFILLGYPVTYFIPWLISVFRKKELSASILGFFVIIIWYPLSVVSLIGAYNAYQHIKTKKEIVSVISPAERPFVLAKSCHKGSINDSTN